MYVYQQQSIHTPFSFVAIVRCIAGAPDKAWTRLYDPGAAPRFWRWGTILRAERAKKNFDPHLLLTWEYTKQNIAHFSLL